MIRLFLRPQSAIGTWQSSLLFASGSTIYIFRVPAKQRHNVIDITEIETSADMQMPDKQRVFKFEPQIIIQRLRILKTQQWRWVSTDCFLLIERQKRCTNLLNRHYCGSCMELSNSGIKRQKPMYKESNQQWWLRCDVIFYFFANRRG